MATRWFRREDGREVGPLSFQTLVAMVREGILKEDDRVRMEHQRKLIAVRDVLGLMQAAQRTPASAAKTRLATLCPMETFLLRRHMPRKPRQPR